MNKGKFSGVLLVSDFDGTIYSSEIGMPARNVEAARYFMDNGGRFTIATGRTHTTFAPFGDTIPVNAPVILSNGASVYDFEKDEMIEETMLPPSATADMVELAKRIPELGFEAYNEEIIYAYRPNHVTEMHIKIVKGKYTECNLSDIPTPWLKVIVQQERDILNRAREEIAKINPNTYETIFSNPRYLEVTAHGVNKGTAVLDMAKRCGITREHIYCMGDNENDLPMMQYAAVRCAPSSSAEIMLATNPQLFCACEEGMLGDVVDMLDKRYT